MIMTIASPIVIHADQEHAALRNTIIITLVGLLFILFFSLMFLYNLIVPIADYRVFLSCVTALPISLGTVYLLEKTLKRRWPSGRSIIIDSQGITHQMVDGSTDKIKWRDDINQTHWYFSLGGYYRGGRERRLPKKAICVACQLQKADERIICHTYMMPRQLSQFNETIGDKFEYYEIDPSEIYDTSLRSRFNAPSRPTVPAQLLGGKNGRYWIAERRRWQESAELEPTDFTLLMQQLHTHQ